MVCMSSNKFKYTIFPENIYLVTVEDWDLNPYTFEISGEEIGAALRREKLLDRAWNQIYNETQEETDG